MGKSVAHILKNVNLDVEEGEYLAIMGPSGSGKTTLMNLIGCLDVPTSGSYLLGGRDVTTCNNKQLAEVRNKELGFVFQSFNLLPKLTALENVALPLLYGGVKKAERLERARAALETVGLSDRVDHRPDQLSGGQCQRVAIARAIVGKPRLLLAGDYAGAKAHALAMRDLFGPDSYYLELQDHGIPQQKQVLQGLVALHQETGIPLVATNDAHYLTRQDAAIQDVLMCIQMGKTVEDPNRMRFETQEFYLKSEQEMAALFPDWPEALENTAKIAADCNVDFQFGVYHLPEFKLPPGYTDGDAYFETLCRQGFARRYPQGSEEYEKQLAYEMDMIRQMGFVEYFLIVSDFIGYAKSHDIPVGPGRGSAAGSMVAYCLDITDVDPMKYSCTLSGS